MNQVIKRGRPRKSAAASERRKKAERLPAGVANPVDVHVGARIRLRRTLLGMSQEKLGDGVGLTFQQIQKYERGANRVGASRLYEFSGILEVPVSFFFDDMPEALKTQEGRIAVGKALRASGVTESDPLARRETLELVRAYYTIDSPAVRKQLFELTKSLGKFGNSERD